MCGFFYNWGIARNFGFWINQFERRQVRAAILTLVAACLREAADRAGSFDKPVGKKSVFLFRKKLFLGFRIQDILIVQRQKNILSCFGMNVVRSSRVNIETDAKVFESLFVGKMI